MNTYAMLWLSTILVFISSCGVKGKPQPPLEPPVLGRGQMNQVSKPQDPKKKKYKSVEPDWEESDDFEDKKR